MKNQPWIAFAVVVLCGVVACNYTVGDCHYRGSEDGSGDVGSGIVNSTGPGNPGDNPTGGQLPTSACNEPDEPDDSSSGNGGSTSGGGFTCDSGAGGDGPSALGLGGSGGAGGGTTCEGGAGGSGGAADPCQGKPATQYIDCRTRGLDANACSAACYAAEAYCPPIAGHPKKTNGGTGKLTWCKNGSPSYTCTYTYPNGDGCARVSTPVHDFWLCCYPGGG